MPSSARLLAESSCRKAAQRCRTAFFKAVSEGERDFEAIAVVGGIKGDFKNYCSPCGVCRQVMSEFCGPDFRVILGKNGEDFRVITLRNLLPDSFALDKE